MIAREKTPAADGGDGGPSSSDEDANDPPPPAPHRERSYASVRWHRSGERDLHHEHDSRRES